MTAIAVRASRVGSGIRPSARGDRAYSSCLRCGIQHSTRRNSTGVCFDCQETDPDYAAALVAARPERTPSCRTGNLVR